MYMAQSKCVPESYSNDLAKPFLKWVGGKTQLLEQLDFYYPEQLKVGEIKQYFELFLGGGAVFFDVIQKYSIERAYLSDINHDLVLTYLVIQQQAEQLIELLSKLEQEYLNYDLEARKQFFYQIREKYNQQQSEIDLHSYPKQWIIRAAWMIFLNKTCFNGLYRTNKKGGFNVPPGRYNNPTICHASNILNVSRVLQTVTIKHGNYKIFDSLIDSNSFVYIDPPYRPISKTANFTSYSQFEFGDRSQLELCQYYRHLDLNYQAKLMLSNSDPQNIDNNDTFFEDIYHNYQINRVSANRMINSNISKRGKVSELVITNY